MGTTLQLSDRLRAPAERAKQAARAPDTRAPGTGRLARWAGLAVAALGAVVLGGWWLEVPLLLSPVPGLPVMTPLTALLMVLSGAALALLARPTAASRGIGRVLAGAVAVIAVAGIVERVAGGELGVSELLRRALALAATPPAPNTLVCFLSLGVALLTLDHGPRRWRAADALAIVTLVVASAALLGYVYGAAALYQGPAAPLGVGMAVHTALGFLVAAAGVLVARPGVGLSRTVMSSYAGGAIARRLLPAALAIPIAGVLVQIGRRFELYDPPVAIAVLTVLATLLAALSTLETSRWLDRSDRARELAAAAERRLATLVESADDAIIASTHDGVVQSWNPAAERMYGHAAREMIGRRIDAIIPPDRRDELAEMLGRIAGGTRVASWETERVRKDGTRVPISLTLSPIYDARCQIVGLSSIARDISQQLATQSALQRSEEQLRALFRQAVDGIFVADLEGRYTEVNDAGCALLGYRREEVVGKTILDLIPPEDVPRLVRSRERMLAGEIDVSEWRLRARDGSFVPVEVSAKILLDGSWQASVRDIRERQAAEAALRRASETERRLRAELEQVLGASGAVSDALAELRDADLSLVLHTIGLQAQNLTHAELVAVGIGTDPEAPFDPWITIGVSDEVARAIGRKPRPVGTFALVARDGEIVRSRDVREHPAFRGLPPHHPEIRSYLAAPIRYAGRSVGNLYLANKAGGEGFDDGDERCIRMIAARVGAAIEAAKVYAGETRQRAWTEAIIEQMPEGVIVLDERGRVALRNQAAQRLAREPSGQDPWGNPTVYDVRTPDGVRIPPDELPLARAFGRGESTSGLELAIVAPNDEWVPILASATPVRVGARIVGAVTIFQDIRTLKELERLREEWAAVVAHDLRQPLNLLAMSSAMLPSLHVGAMPEREARTIERISGAVRSLDRMVRDLLDTSRIEAHRMTVDRRDVELVQLVRGIVERAAGAIEGDEVELVAGAPVRVMADPERIEQVLANLLSNAAKYRTPGTPIAVEIVEHEREAEVVVTNRGPGIAPEDLPLLFTRFARTSEARRSGISGIGLGLYIAKGLIEAHGGRLWAESVPGDTTSFRFTLLRAE